MLSEKAFVTRILSSASLTEIQDVVKRNCSGLIGSPINVETKWNPDDEPPILDTTLVERGDVVQVRVDYDFRLVTGGLVLDRGVLPMSATARMIVAN